MKRCDNCGHQNDDMYKFCESCGMELKELRRTVSGNRLKGSMGGQRFTPDAANPAFVAPSPPLPDSEVNPELESEIKKNRHFWPAIVVGVVALIVVVALIISITGGFSYKEAAGYYEGDNGDWLWLEFDEETKDTTGEIFIGGVENNIFWEYDFDEKHIEITIWEAIGNTFPFEFEYYDIYADYYEDGTISILYDGTFHWFEKTSDAFEHSEIATESMLIQESAWLDKEQAAENGGFYIMDGDRFYLLGKCWGMDTYYDSPAEYVFAAENVDIPVVSSETPLVLFTTDDMGKVQITPTGNNGYTLPMNFRDYDGMAGEIENKLYSDRLFYYSDAYPEIINLFSDSEFEAASAFYQTKSSHTVIEEFDGQNAMESSDLITVAGYHFLDEYSYILDCTKNQVVSIGYSVGSTWYETSFRACVKYWESLDDNNIEAMLNITKDGYYIVDTSSLANGTYLLQYTGDSYWANYTHYEGALFLISTE